MNLRKQRTKIQMFLTILVVLSVIRQFFLGNYHNMFLGILTLFYFMVPAMLDQTLGVTIPVGLETVILIFIFSAEILGEIHAFLCQDSNLGHGITYNKRVPYGGNWLRVD